MKKLFFIIVVIIPSVCFSQTYVGVKSDYSLLSNISFLPDIKSTIYTGKALDYGLVVKHYDNKWVGFQGEFYFTQRGYNAPYKETNTFRRINSYVELPIFLQGHIRIKGLYLHANAGCYAAYLLSAKEGVDTTGNMVLSKVHFNILRDNRFDYGLIGGIGLSYEFKWGVVQVEARILYGYADLFKYDYEYEIMPQQSKSIAQNISFCYMYNLSKLFQNKKPEGGR